MQFRVSKEMHNNIHILYNNGETMKYIAEMLGICLHTVFNHLQVGAYRET